MQQSSRKNHLSQVVNCPDPKKNCCYNPPEREYKNRGVSAIKSCSYNITNFFCIPTTGSRALWAAESGPLFLKVHTCNFGLREWDRKKPVSLLVKYNALIKPSIIIAEATYLVINVTTILADPFALPIHGCLGFFFSFLSCCLLFTKHHIQTGSTDRSCPDRLDLRAESISGMQATQND